MWLQSSGVLCPLLPACKTTKAVINGTEMGCTGRPDCLGQWRESERKERGDGEKRTQASISCPARIWLVVQLHQGISLTTKALRQKVSWWRWGGGCR